MPDQIQAVKTKLKEQGKEIIRMNKNERVLVFNQALKNGELANELNNRFQKAVESKRKGALKHFLDYYLTEETPKATEEEKKQIEKSIIGSIEKLSERGVLNEKIFDKFIEEAVRVKLGIEVTIDEVKDINKLVDEMHKYKPGKLGSEETMNYLKARQDIESYISAHSQSPFLDQLTKIYGRGNLLAAPASMITNIISNTSMTITEKVKRLLQQNIGKSYLINGRIFETGANPELVTKYIKDAQNIYQKTGVDVTRIMSIQDEALTLGEKRTHSTNKLFKLYEDIIFKQGLGAPDVFFSAYNFASNLNITTTIMARSEGLSGEALKKRAAELFEQATDVINSRSPVAELLREGASYSAQLATYQNNDRALTQGLLKVRESIDEMFPFLNIGSNLDPFIKTPANVFMTSLDYAGLTAPHATYTLLRELKQATPDPKVIERATGTLISAGIGQAIAFMIASMLDDDDYMPDYVQATPKQREMQKLGNGVFYGIKFGDTWFSLVYLGGVGVSIAAVMQARQALAKSGAETPEGKAVDAAIGASGSVMAAVSQLPLINHIFQTAEFYGDEYRESGDEKLAALGRGVVDQVMARSIPAFVRTIGNMTDEYQRQKDYTLGARDAILESIQANLPILRENLQPRYSTFGNKLETKPWWQTLLFGSRAAQQMNDPVFNEMTRLNQEGQNTNIKASTYKPLKEAKQYMMTPEYNAYLGAVQQRIKKKLDILIETEKYKRQTPQNQAIMMANVRESAVKEVSREMGLDYLVKGWNPATKKLVEVDN